MTEAEGRAALVDAGQRLMVEGLVARSWGNVSVRLDDRTMLITPSGIPWADLTEPMASVVDLETGTWTGAWKPSGERKVHREIYRRRPDVNAIVHTHQSAASVWAAARRPVAWGRELVACAPYALPGTKSLTLATVGALGQGSAVLMANHGVFTVGPDLEAAFDRIRSLERACADQLVAGSNPLPARADATWSSEFLAPVTEVGAPQHAWWSTAPFTVAWSQSGRALPALLDDLAQLAGTRVKLASKLPRRLPESQVVLVRGRGAVVGGPDAEALAMVIEKTARAALASRGLGGAHPFPAWEALLMRLVYKNSYAKQASRPH